MESIKSQSDKNSTGLLTNNIQTHGSANNLLLKSVIELTAEEEKKEAESLGNAYFFAQKIAGKFPALVNKIYNAILENHDDKKGSLTIAIKNQNNSLREIKCMSGTRGRHATSNITNISKVDAIKINQKLKTELKSNFKKTGQLLDEISHQKDNIELLNKLSLDVQQWELTPKIRGLFFIEIRKITKAFKNLNIRGQRLIKEKCRLRYESVVIDLVSKGQLPGLDKKLSQRILEELSGEIIVLESLCGTNISLVLDDIKQLTIFDKKLIDSQNKLVMSCQKYISYIVNTYARKNALSDSERDDIMQDMTEMVISQALYHFDGSFKLSTYINRYFDQCKSLHLKKREILPLRAKVTKHARLYYEAKKTLENEGSYVTSQQIADYVNNVSQKAKATCETVDELFGLCTLSIDTSFTSDHDNDAGVHNFLTNDDNVTESSTYSPLFDIFEHISHSEFERKIYDYITVNFSKEYATLYVLRHGLLSNQPSTYEQLVESTGYSKDVLRRRFAEIAEALQKRFGEAL